MPIDEWHPLRFFEAPIGLTATEAQELALGRVIIPEEKGPVTIPMSTKTPTKTETQHPQHPACRRDGHMYQTVRSGIYGVLLVCHKCGDAIVRDFPGNGNTDDVWEGTRTPRYTTNALRRAAAILEADRSALRGEGK